MVVKWRRFCPGQQHGTARLESYVVDRFETRINTLALGTRRLI